MRHATVPTTTAALGATSAGPRPTGGLPVVILIQYRQQTAREEDA